MDIDIMDMSFSWQQYGNGLQEPFSMIFSQYLAKVKASEFLMVSLQSTNQV